jgi:hypothetical protein
VTEAPPSPVKRDDNDDDELYHLFFFVDPLESFRFVENRLNTLMEFTPYSPLLLHELSLIV